MRNATVKVVVMSLLAALLVPVLAAGAGAAQRRTLVIRPEMFKNINPADTVSYQQTPVSISATGKIFWRRVRLPVGATVTGLEILALDFGTPVGEVTLIRRRAAAGLEPCNSPFTCSLAIVNLADVDGTAPFTWKWLASTDGPVSRRIDRGYDYLVFVQIGGGVITGPVRIRYLLP